jgi:hypothetical protein
MARRNQRSRARTSSHPSNPSPKGGFHGLSRRAQVWLATLGTIVGVGTGMFTLADEVAPKHAGSAQASLPQYQQSIAAVCGEINRHERDRAQEAGKLARRLRKAKTTLAQRNALLESTLRSLRNGEHDLAMFASLDAPQALRTAERTTAWAWSRNLERVRDYAHRLDLVSSRAKFYAAITTLAGIREPQQRDGTTLRTELLRLGGGQCKLDPERVTKVVTLPDLPEHPRPQVNVDTPRVKVRQSSGGAVGAVGVAPKVAITPPKASATAPAARVNAPGVSSGGNSLGG